MILAQRNPRNPGTSDRCATARAAESLGAPVVAFTLCLLASGAVGAGDPEVPSVAVRAEGSVLALEPNALDAGSSYSIRVIDPEGRVLADTRQLAEPRLLDLVSEPFGGEPLLDGAYRYEVLIVRKVLGADGEVVESARREPGRFVVDGGVIVSLEAASRESEQPPDPGSVRQRAEEVVRVASAANVVASESTPTVFFNDTDETAQVYEWRVFALNPAGGADSRFTVHDDVNDNDVITIDEGTNSDSIVVDVVGDISLANDGFFLDRSSSRLGIGTTAAAESLHISSSNPAIRFQDTTASETMTLRYDTGLFSLQNDAGATVVGVVDGAPSSSLWITTNGNVGLGNPNPTARLHVQGSARIAGDVSLGSSRTIKHELERVAVGEVLAEVLELPLYRWKYTADPEQADHVGPMAEDFHARFALGTDDRHLSPADSAGIALAAVQGLNARLLETQRRLEAENAELRSRIERLEQLLPREATGSNRHASAPDLRLADRQVPSDSGR